MDTQIPWIISIALATLSSFLSFLTAYLSNRHQLFLKKAELNHDKDMHEMDLKQQSFNKQLDVFYSEKKMVFSALMDKASSIICNLDCLDDYVALQTAAHQAILY